MVGPPETALVLSPEQRAALAAFVDARIERIAQGLVEEAAASDDVLSAADAEAFVADRLAEFGDVLTEAQGRALMEAARKGLAAWGG
jgi:hypothetical protein